MVTMTYDYKVIPERIYRVSLLALLLIMTGRGHAQSPSSPRSQTSFDGGWELYPLGKINQPATASALRRGTSFESQFNDEHITGRNQSTDSIIQAEWSEAIQGFEREYPSIRPLQWTPVTLPCPVRYEQQENPAAKQFQGICYYRKKFNLPVSARDKQWSIRFDGAMQVASVWINGKFVLQHQGGYLPFTVALNPYIRFDSANEIIVRLDNRDNRNTPPGKPLARLGFLYWSGIYRNAWLIAVDPVHITDPIQANTIAGGGVFVRDENVSACSAKVLITTQVGNDLRQSRDSLEVRQVITDAGGKVVLRENAPAFVLAPSEKREIAQETLVRTPHLWSPDDPYLYRLTTQVWRRGKLLDQLSQPIGIRSLSYSRWEGFTLNGKPLRIVGTNRHQDHPYIGNALSDAAQYRDLKRIKESGMNFVRLAHYPQDPAVFDICDSLGLMVADPIPGWQFFNNNDIFKKRVYRDIRELVRRDRNHPCVIMWEMSLNESYPPDSFRIQSAYVAHEEYPGNQFFTSGDTYGAKKTAWDIPYNSWEDPFGRPQDVQPERPGFVREYGHYEFGGERSTTNADRSKGEQSLLYNAWNLQWEHNLLRGPAYYPWTIGDASWAFFDGFEAYTAGTTDWGLMDLFRIPKFSYYFFRSQMAPYSPVYGADSKPMVYIANWWTPEDTNGQVVVYSNCDRVALYLNDHLIREQAPDKGPDSPYGDWNTGGNPFDGGNCAHLEHPPFTFTHIPWQSGELKAIAFIKGKEVSENIVRTPGAPSGLRVNADTMGMSLVADGADAIFVHVRIVDPSGTTLAQDTTTLVTFKVSGAGEIISPATIKARGGIATIMVKSTTRPGLVSIWATTQEGLKGAMTLRSVKGTGVL
jgi:beta-galactosidase